MSSNAIFYFAGQQYPYLQGSPHVRSSRPDTCVHTQKVKRSHFKTKCEDLAAENTAGAPRIYAPSQEDDWCYFTQPETPRQLLTIYRPPYHQTFDGSVITSARRRQLFATASTFEDPLPFGTPGGRPGSDFYLGSLELDGRRSSGEAEEIRFTDQGQSFRVFSKFSDRFTPSVQYQGY